MDEIIIFNPLSKENIGGIVKLQLSQLAQRLKDQQDLELELTRRALDFLVDEGYDPQLGARPLKRAVQKYVLNPLSMKLLAGEIIPGSTVRIDYNGKELVFA